ncbi:MAG: hypothetical protein ABGZ53_29255 [Fuerstiella sp.]
MVTKTRKRKSTSSKKRFIGKPTGQLQERVQAVGPEHFGVVAVDCGKRRSKWMLCDFYGRVIVEPTPVEHTAGGLKVMTQRVTEACRTEGFTASIVAVEMTGIYLKPSLWFRDSNYLQHLFADNRGVAIADDQTTPDLGVFQSLRPSSVILRQEITERV